MRYSKEIQKCRAQLLHSYSGSSEWMRQLVSMKQKKGNDIYFGFSSVVNLRGWKKTLENVQRCPDNRIVVESDLVSCENVENELRKIVAFIAKAKGWSVKKLRASREKTPIVYMDVNYSLSYFLFVLKVNILNVVL